MFAREIIVWYICTTFFFFSDVTDQCTIDASKETVQKTIGTHGLNCLINNAGLAKFGEKSISKVTADTMRKIYEVNVIGPAMVTKVN